MTKIFSLKKIGEYPKKRTMKRITPSRHPAISVVSWMPHPGEAGHDHFFSGLSKIIGELFVGRPLSEQSPDGLPVEGARTQAVRRMSRVAKTGTEIFLKSMKIPMGGGGQSPKRNPLCIFLRPTGLDLINLGIIIRYQEYCHRFFLAIRGILGYNFKKKVRLNEYTWVSTRPKWAGCKVGIIP